LYGPDVLVSPIWQKGQRTQHVYLPAGSRWKDAWSGKMLSGGQEIVVPAGLHQVPVFTREGSRVELGDLNREWREAVAAARRRPNLKALEAADPMLNPTVD
jgi:alpha-D-xyloside xylohydrolase